MKKLLLFYMFLLAPVFAADKLHVKALDDFSSIEPKDTFKVELIDDGMMYGVYMLKGDIINCTLERIKDPTRAKQDAKIFFNVISYVDNLGEHEIKEPLIGKYAKTVINKEEIKKTPPRKIVKKTASTVGGFFVKGFSYGVSFVDGVAQNEEGNRIKSGAKQVYKDSFLSLVELGQEVVVNKDDIFYLVIKPKKETKSSDE